MNIVVVAEGLKDAELACGLADRVAAEEAPEWISDQLDIFRKWTGLRADTFFTKWTELKSLANQQKIRVLGHQREEHGGFDYASARKAIALCRLHAKHARILLLVRDLDRQEQNRQRSLEEARAYSGEDSLTVVLALPNPMREAWLLNGFIPQTATERISHANEKRAVGFDPCKNAERLSARHDEDLRSPKRVLHSLTNGARDREEACWRETSLAFLQKRGEATNLAAYIEEIRSHFLPALTEA